MTNDMELIAPQPAIPEGMVMVPIEPTEAMIDAGKWQIQALNGLKSAYKAMIAAAEVMTEARVTGKLADAFEQDVISGFYEEEIPQFRQGTPQHELESVVTAEEVTAYVQKIAWQTDRIKALEAEVEHQINDSQQKLEWIHNLIRNDAWAITFQSLGQYRSALLKELNK